MNKTYLTVASHWHVPGIRQYASPDRPAAERKAAELVEELRADWQSHDADHDRDAKAPPPANGADWDSTLRALQLCRLIDYYGGEGEANDTLFEFCQRTCRGEPPLIGEGFTAELQDIIGEFVTEDDCDPDKIGFPMVWIEEVEAADQEQTSRPFRYFAARDGETVTDTVFGENEELARIAARIEIAKAFRMEEQLDQAYTDGCGDMSEFDAELDGFTVEEIVDQPLPIDLIVAARRVVAAFGGNVPDWLRDEIGMLDLALKPFADSALPVPEEAPVPQPVRLILGMEGGIVQGGWADGAVDVTIFDYDTEGADADRIMQVLQDVEGTTAEAYVAGASILIRPEFVDKALAALDEATPDAG